MTTPGRILVAEDDRFYRQILAKRLAAVGHDVVLTCNGREAWEVIQADPPEVVVSDWMMPQLDGVELCRLVKNDPARKSVYVILLTAKDRVEDKVAALDVGADDYLLKPCDDGELLARVRTGLRVHRLYAQLEEVSITDSLTGLRNRRYFDQRLEEEVSHRRRHSGTLALLFVDLDYFKSVNDEHGHPVGDEVLAAIGTMLLQRVRSGELAARIGGDEFAILLPDTSLDGAHKLARTIEGALGALSFSATGLKVGGSAGCAILEPGMNSAALMKAADLALYARKQERRATPA